MAERRASLGFDFTSSWDGMGMAAASKQVEKMRKRRHKTFGDPDSVPIGQCLSDTEATVPSGSQTRTSGSSSPTSPYTSSAMMDLSPIQDIVAGLKQVLEDRSHALESKMDTVISHLDAHAERHATDLHQMLAIWQLKCNGSVSQLHHPSPRVSQGKIRATASSARVKHAREASSSQRDRMCLTPPQQPSAFSPRSFEEEIEPLELAPGHKDVPESRFNAARERTMTFSHSSASGSTTLDSRLITEALRTRKRGKTARILWLYLEDPRLMPGGQSYVRALILVILVSWFFNVVQTVKSPPFGSLIEDVVYYTVDCILIAEIVVRFIVCPNRLSFWANGLNLLDLLTGPLTLIARIAIPSAYSDDSGSTASILFKAWLPLGQLLRVLRRFESSYLIYTAFLNASEALPMLFYILLLIITTFASLLYALEPRDNIGSLPEAFWFTVVSLGTVGYGDVTPVTAEGKIVTCVLVIVSALYMAMPLGIVGQVFSEVWDDRKRLLLTQLARQRFKSLGFTAKDIPAMFLAADVNKDGVLNMQEFTNMMKTWQFDTSGERAVELFKVFDVDGGGTIDDQEFLSTLYPDAATIIYGEDGEDKGNLVDKQGAV